METINVHEAKTHLSRLLERARAGEEIILAKSGKPYARLLPLESGRPRRQPGLLKGWTIPASFDDTLPDAGAPPFIPASSAEHPARR